jgi:glucan phosphoethanolaminetransferase (alkaline phosphatase superfamily)
MLPKQGITAVFKNISLNFLVWVPFISMTFLLKGDVLKHSSSSAHSITAFGVDLVSDFLALSLVSLASLAIPVRWRFAPSAAICSVLILFGYVQHRCVETVGMFQSFHSLREAVFWASTNKDVAAQYLGFTIGYVALFLMIVGTWALAIWARSLFSRSSAISVAPAVGAFACALVMTTLSAPHVRTSAFWDATKAFMSSAELSQKPITTDEALAEYRQLSEIAPSHQPTPYHGVAKDCDLLWFLLETAPAQCLPADDPLKDFPNLKRLAAHSFVAKKHYTTFPATLQSISSMLMSCYPPKLETLESIARTKALPGIGSALQRRGYNTAIYSADPLLDSTQEWLKAAGIGRIWTAEPVPRAIRLLLFQGRLERDLVTLKAMLSDLTNWTESNHRYFIIFDPQIGHGIPWDLGAKVNTPLKTPEDMLVVRRQIIQLQDEWLGQVISILERTGHLNRTVIMVTGDHGVRSTLEDPSLHAGMLDDRSFHVPFYLYVPMVKKSIYIDYVTSHIDIGPSFFELLGIEKDRREQGSPLWDEQIANRTTFLWGSDFMGVDGFHKGNRFFSVSALSKEITVALSGKLNHGDFQPTSPQESEAATSKVEGMRKLVGQWPALEP